MNLRHLILREIRHRLLNFTLAVISVAVAVGCLVAALLAREVHDQRTHQILAEKQLETEKRMQELEDDYRKITLGLGFNVLILPKDQNLADLYADDYASKYMPEEYAGRLANSKIVTINHLLPSLQQKVTWPETKRTILLIGTRGEVPLLHKGLKKPLLEPVEDDQIVVGYELHQSLGLELGSQVELFGREFTVSRLHEKRGNKDDITVWIDLDTAQEILDKEGLINAMLAIECHCALAELDKVREEISAILPDTQVIEFRSKALARAEARKKAAEAARSALEAEKTNRAKLGQELDSFTSTLVPIVILGCGLWIGLLTLGNVRERIQEIGILRALGLRARDILAVFLGKAALVGLLGGLLACPAGFLAGVAWGRAADPATDLGVFPEGLTAFLLMLVTSVLIAAPLLAMLSSWVPALVASQQDPAAVLREE